MGDESDASKQAREQILDPAAKGADALVDYTARGVRKAKDALTSWVQGPWWMWFGIGVWLGLRRRK